jgi:hypothetical protein
VSSDLPGSDLCTTLQVALQNDHLVVRLPYFNSSKEQDASNYVIGMAIDLTQLVTPGLHHVLSDLHVDSCLNSALLAL